MGASRLDVLVFVEDPGAANMVIGLDEALRAHGLVARIFAPDHLGSYLNAHRQSYLGLGDPAEVLDSARPRAILVGTSENPDAVALALVVEGRRRGLPTAAVVDGPANAQHRFRGRSRAPLTFAPDRLAVPDEATAQAYFDLGFPGEGIAVCGHPHHDRTWAARRALEDEGRERVRRRVFPDAPAARRVVLFLSELSDGLDPLQFVRNPEYSLAGRGGSDRRTDIVLEEVLDALGPVRDSVHFALRLHPKNRPEEFARFGREIDGINAGGAAWDAVFAADIVVGMTTVLLLESVVLGRPTVSVLPRVCEKTWLEPLARGAIRSVTTRSELRSLLPQVVTDPTILAAPAMASLVRPGAKERLAAWIAEMLGARTP